MSQPLPIRVAEPPVRNPRAAAAGQQAVTSIVAAIVLDRVEQRVPRRLPVEVSDIRLVRWNRLNGGGRGRGL